MHLPCFMFNIGLSQQVLKVSTSGFQTCFAHDVPYFERCDGESLVWSLESQSQCCFASPAVFAAYYHTHDLWEFPIGRSLAVEPHFICGPHEIEDSRMFIKKCLEPLTIRHALFSIRFYQLMDDCDAVGMNLGFLVGLWHVDLDMPFSCDNRLGDFLGEFSVFVLMHACLRNPVSCSAWN
jgi:hypothetical protein